MSEVYDVTIEVPEDADVEQAGETVTVEVGADEYVLPKARDAGLWLEADCQQGWCTLCAAELVEGEIDHGHARRYYDVDEEEGYVLTCRARPRSDLRLRAFSYRDMLEHRAEHDLPPGNSKL